MFEPVNNDALTIHKFKNNDKHLKQKQEKKTSKHFVNDMLEVLGKEPNIMSYEISNQKFSTRSKTSIRESE